MTKQFITIYDTAKKLPDIWDWLASQRLFLQRQVLEDLENVNPCGQKYYIIGAENKSIAVSYQLKLDILTYSQWNLKLPVTIIGIPCSVSEQGVIWGEERRNHEKILLEQIKGLVIMLNMDQSSEGFTGGQGSTLPTCEFAVRWNSFQEYLQDMRSHYRYRVQKAMKKWENIQISLVLPEEFDEELYELYLQVYQRSEYKLEKLPILFFQTFPAEIVQFSKGGKALGFVQIREHEKELTFLFGGFDYEVNFQYDIYMNILLEIIKIGIKKKGKTIHMGQTAEETKMKLGCRRVQKHMMVHHSNPVINRLIGPFVKLFSYKPESYDFHVFKGEQDEGTIRTTKEQ